MTEKQTQVLTNAQMDGSKSAPVKSKKTKEVEQNVENDKSKPKGNSKSKSKAKASKAELMEIKQA